MNGSVVVVDVDERHGSALLRGENLFPIVWSVGCRYKEPHGDGALAVSLADLPNIEAALHAAHRPIRLQARGRR